MTSPGAASAGNLHADIIPDVSGFTERLRRDLGKLNLPPVKVTAEPNLAGFSAELRRQVSAAPNVSVKVRAEPDLTGFGARLRTAVAALPNQQVKVGATPVVTGFNTALRAALTALPTVEAQVRAVPTVTGFNVALRAALRALPAVDHPVNATPSVTGFNVALRAALAALPTQDARVDITPRLTGFNAALRTALAALPQLSTQVRIDPKVAGFQARLRTALAGLPPIFADIQLSPDVTGFVARLNAAVNAAKPTPVIKVRVDPDLTGFRQRLRAAVAALGTVPTIRVRIEPDLTGFGGEIASAARAGGSAGGAYAATFRSVVQAALRNLPEPTIGVATSAADQAIREFRASLERLGAERVGVTISADQAMAEIRNLRADIIRLRAMSPVDVDVDVEANIRAAEAALARMETQLHNIGRDRTANVRIRTDQSQLNALQTALLGSTNRMQLLITAGLALGPAIVPAAAAAAAAIGAIGGAAIAAGAGLGVGVLALSGVVGAVKALNDARNDAAKTAATEAKQDKQLATGADQVRSAVASLANTRAQAASQARQSAQAIADAERGLADAQRDALRAQQDITRAREEAQDALEDLDSSIKANATSIKQANLDLADAEAALAKVRNLPPDNRARIEAEIAYERAKQNLDDLTTRQGRLAEEKKRSDKAGIEGSQQVVAAQERIGDAQKRVQEAERNVAEARTAAAEQARQSAFSIAQAQQAVVAAQRSVATSAVSTASTAGAAIDTLAEKMANLSPQGRKFAEFIVGLQPELITLRKSAEQALPGFEQGIRALLPALPALNDFVRRVAAALGDMAEATGKGLNSDRLRPFFSYIDATAVPTLRELGEAAGNVGVGFANMVVGFAPAQRQITGGLVDMTARFEAWSATLDRNNGFQRFLDYAITRGPIVLRTLGDLSGTIVHLLEASAPAGDVVLTILTGIAHAIDAIPVPVLSALLGTMTALRIAALLTAIPVGALGASLATLPGRLIAMTTSMGAARAGLASFAATLGGPVTLAIAAATFGIGYLIAQSAKHRAEVDRLKASMDSYGNALKNGLTPESRLNAAAIVAQDEALQGLVDATTKAGISQQTVAAGLNGNRAAREQVIDALNRQIAEEKNLASQAYASGGADDAAAKAHSGRAAELERLRVAFAKTSGSNLEAAELAARLAAEDRNLEGAVTAVRTALETAEPSADQFASAINLVGNLAVDAGGKTEAFAAIAGKVAASNLDAADKADLFGRILGQIGSAAGTQGATFDALAGTFNDIAASSINAEDKVQLLRRAMEQMYGAARAQTEANEALIRSKSDLTTQLATNSAGFDLNRAKGEANTKAILDNRDALQAALLKAEEKYYQDLANGVAEDVAREAHRKNIDQILKGIEPTQRNSAAVGDLVKTYGTLPDKKTTAVTTPGLDKAIDELIQAYAIQQGIANGWTQDRIAAQVKILKSNIVGGYAGDPSAYKKADGGLIEGWSPHPRADNIPAWLTAREFVQPVHTVDYYGVDAMEAIRQRRIPRDALRGYAFGGLVTKVPQEWPVNMPVTAKMPYTIDELWAKYNAAQRAKLTEYGAGPGFPPWPAHHPGAGGTYGDSGVWRSIVALIRSTGPLSGSFGNAYRPGDPLWHGCVPMDTRILTRRGWISRDEIRIGEDETIGYNPATGKNEWTLIVDVVEYDDAELWTLKNSWVELEVTPGHKWLVDQQVTVQTETVCTECGREFATGRGMTKHRADVHGVLTPRRERFEEQLVATQDFKQSTRVHLSKPADLGGQLPISDDEAELIGWIFADGYMEPYGPTIVQSKPEEVQYLKRFMTKFPCSEYTRKPSGHQRYLIYRWKLSFEYWTDLASRSKANKADALNFVFSLSPSQREAFVRGFLSADGTRDPRTQNEKLGFSAFQVSGPMAEAMKVAAYLEGYRPDTNVTTEFDEARFGTQPMERIGFRTPIVKGRNLPVVAKRTAKVWCPTTTLGTWTARQGEEIFLTGNSGRAVDWMGYKQDALAQFFMNMRGRVLELIHRTPTRDYAVTRGRDKGSFNNALMEQHRNHVHIAMADGGLVPNVGPSLAQTLNIPHLIRDQGGWIPPGLSLVSNQTGSYEAMFNQAQLSELSGATSGRRGGGDVHIDNFNAYSAQSPRDIALELDWTMRHGG